jgi:hypothetical protein
MHPIRQNISPVVPQPIAGAPRRRVVSEQLLTNAAAGFYGTTSVSFQLVTPSTRLVSFFALTFEPDVTPPGSGLGAFTLRADAYVRGSREQGGSLMRANTIVAGIALPWSLNAPAQAVDQIRGVVTIPNLPGTNVDATTLWVTAIWEPAPGDNIPDDELQKIFGLCSLVTQGGTSSKTGVP